MALLPIGVLICFSHVSPIYLYFSVVAVQVCSQQDVRRSGRQSLQLPGEEGGLPVFRRPIRGPLLIGNYWLPVYCSLMLMQRVAVAALILRGLLRISKSV